MARSRRRSIGVAGVLAVGAILGGLMSRCPMGMPVGASSEVSANAEDKKPESEAVQEHQPSPAVDKSEPAQRGGATRIEVIGSRCRVALGAFETCREACQRITPEQAKTPIEIDGLRGADGVVETLIECLHDAGHQTTILAD